MAMAAVGALPVHLAVLFKDAALFDGLEQLAVPLLVLLFDLADLLKQEGDVIKARCV